jgi:hypothetical protein
MDTPLRNALPIVARALGEQYALEVRIEGEAACTDGRIITLPAVDGPEARTLAYGYLDHEAGHVRFTDFDVYREAATQPLRTALVNILEDVRIERAMSERFPGCRVNLHRLVRLLVETGEFQAASLDEHPGAVLQRYLLYRLRERVLGQDALEGLAAQAEQVFKTRFPPAVAAEVDEVMGDILKAQSTADGVALADRILKALQSGAPSARSEGDHADRARSPDTASTQPGQSDSTAAQASGSPECDAAESTPDSILAAPLEPTDLDTVQPAPPGEESHNLAEAAASRALCSRILPKSRGNGSANRRRQHRRPIAGRHGHGGSRRARPGAISTTSRRWPRRLACGRVCRRSCRPKRWQTFASHARGGGSALAICGVCRRATGACFAAEPRSPGLTPRCKCCSTDRAPCVSRA